MTDAAQDRADLDGLLARAWNADGVKPLNEAARYALSEPSGIRQEFVHRDGVLVGYGQVDDSPPDDSPPDDGPPGGNQPDDSPPDDGPPGGNQPDDNSRDDGPPDDDSPPQAWLVVDPVHRRKGIGTELARRIGDIDGLHVWAHGDLPGARPLAAKIGLDPTRILLRLERDMTGPVSEGTDVDGVTIRAFVPGQDDAAFLGLNARAFANHPEQGAMTQADLDQRKDSDWFDADGFFLAERGGELIGFHWTKTHSDPPVGEVYVVGVAPSAQGLGLGTSLTAHGLRHLQQRGLERVVLYVEGDNERALGVYRGLGFTEAMRDVQYSRA